MSVFNIFISAAEVAKYLDVHYRTIENWAAQGYLERDSKGKYGLISAFKYKIKQLSDELAEIKDNPQAELKQQKLAADVEIAKALAIIKNLEADEKAGKLVDVEAVKLGWQNAVAKAKAKFLTIPSKLALELSGMDKPSDIQVRLTTVIDEALTELGEID